MRTKQIIALASFPALYLIFAFITLDWWWVPNVTGDARGFFMFLAGIVTLGAVTFPDN